MQKNIFSLLYPTQASPKNSSHFANILGGFWGYQVIHASKPNHSSNKEPCWALFLLFLSWLSQRWKQIDPCCALITFIQTSKA